MNKTIIAVIMVLTSFSVNADLKATSEKGTESFVVYDETIDGSDVDYDETLKGYGLPDNVTFSLSNTTVKTGSVQVVDVNYKCKKDRYSINNAKPSYAPPKSVMRTAGEYACEYSRNIKNASVRTD